MPGRYNIAATTMDETPEEMDQIRREAGEIDVYRYRNRFRWLRAIGVGALMAGLVWLILTMLDSRRNPCERVRDHFCKKDPAGIQCTSYREIMEESLHDDSSAMRANIKAQCQTKIDRLKEDDGVEVK
jgi:hypothetical protein